MSFGPGIRLGGYEIVALIGAGGMGEVYRARDIRLKRDVAIKVLPDAFANDAERLARFRREAELLATLNHPNIAQIYGLEQSALVLELVEGPTLADRITQGPIPVEEALALARQIAEALEAAHDRGIIHRDLKPANIKLTPEGTVKVLDFGLAKASDRFDVARNVNSVDLSASPTITSPAVTAAVGVILGTAAYMSPEQAKGKAVNKRTDVWAFGCVLFEMLTGRRAFEGEDVSDTLAAVLRAEPNWSTLPAGLPAHIRLLVHKCLDKNPSTRVPDAAAARFLLTENIPGGTTVSAAPRKWHYLVAVVAVALAAAVLAAAAAIRWRPSEARPVTRFTYHLPANQIFTGGGRHVIALSDDGSQMAFVSNTGLYRRVMSQRDPTLLTTLETNTSPVLNSPVFSPDGRWIAFWTGSGTSGGFIKKVATSGGSPVTLCPATNPFGISWHGDDILFGQVGRGIFRVDAGGGTPELIVAKGQNELGAPRMLPDGRHMLYTSYAANRSSWDTSSILIHELGASEPTVLIRNGADARYVSTGHLAFAQQGVLMAAPFDAARLALRGEAIPVVEGVRRSLNVGAPAAHFAVSTSGTLAYLAGPVTLTAGNFDVALLDRSDASQRLHLPPHPYTFPRFSPDGRYLAVGVEGGSTGDIWIHELNGASSLRRLTFGGSNVMPAWTGDSKRIAFQSDREGDRAIFWQAADGSGTAERLTKPGKGQIHWPYDWSRIADVLLFGVQEGTTFSPWTLSAKEQRIQPFGNVRTTQLSGVFSPDGRWIAYSASGSSVLSGSLAGQNVIYLQPFPATGSVNQIGSGINPFWSADTNKLYYSPGPTNYFHEVIIRTAPSFSVSKPTQIPRTGAMLRIGFPRNYDIAPDGRRFAIIVDTSNATTVSPTIEVVLNWTDELERRVPRSPQ